LAFIAVGVRKLVKNLKTNRYGYETYGVVLQIFPTGKSVNSRPILCAEISLVKEDGTTEIFKEDIGFNEKRYHTGAFLKVKYFENDVNILEKLHEANVPFNYVDMLKRDLNEQYNSNFDMYGTYTDEFADIESTEF
jgi:arginyl-tRNA synthetase